MQPVNIAIVGLGAVGTGTLSVLRRNAHEIARRAGRDIQVKYVVVKDLQKSRTADLTDVKLIDNVFLPVEDASIDIIVELMGGEQLALELVLAAIEKGKHVVTTNKALIAKYGNEIFAAAHRKGVMVAFEAAVAGGIPIIKSLREGLSGNQIESILGIINRTSNYILSEMRHEGVDFSTALSQAQALGYAEADPTYDIEGVDIAHKLTILSAIAFGVPLSFDEVTVESITKITHDDIIYARDLGYAIKHLGITKKNEAGIELRVHPTLIPQAHTMSHVNGAMNALLVNADAVGPTMYYGAGAGSEPTASAVVADLVDVVRTLTADPNNRVPHLAFQPDALTDLNIMPMSEVQSAYYLRITAQDKPGVLADVTRILGQLEISIESILQKEQELYHGYVPIIIVTHRVKDAKMQEAIFAIEQLDQVKSDILSLRIENF